MLRTYILCVRQEKQSAALTTSRIRAYPIGRMYIRTCVASTEAPRGMHPPSQTKGGWLHEAKTINKAAAQVLSFFLGRLNIRPNEPAAATNSIKDGIIIHPEADARPKKNRDDT